jgi:glycosyltransferase involved in cell wall biosynthesis
MRIAIDARAADGPPTGIRWYVRTLIHALAASPEENRYLLLRHGAEGAVPLASDPRFEQMEVPAAGDAWMDWNLHSLLAEWETDLYHSPLAPPPVVRPCRAIMTVHDIIPRVMPELVGEQFRQYFTSRVVPGFRRCDHLIAVSQHTAHDVRTFFGISPERITVVPEAAPPEHVGPVDPDRANQALAELGIRRPYFLSVGAVEPRKNVVRLLEAFQLLTKEFAEGVRLVVVGAARDQAEDAARALDAAADGSRVIWLEHATCDQLRAVYSQALAFAFPSLYEGFGLPVLEAMSHGLPVIASRVSALPELVGKEAGLLVDPYDAADLATAMRRVWEDGALRRALSEAAKARAGEFSLAGMGEGTRRAYQKAYHGGANSQWL